jgi:hypothetical protein
VYGDEWGAGSPATHLREALAATGAQGKDLMHERMRDFGQIRGRSITHEANK